MGTMYDSIADEMSLCKGRLIPRMGDTASMGARLRPAVSSKD